MADNTIPRSYDPLVQLLEDAADGAHDHEAAIGLKQNTEAAIRADLVALVGKPAGPLNLPPAVPGLRALWNTAKAEKSAKGAAFRSAKSSGVTVARASVNILKPRLGNAWTAAWQAAGFTNGTLEIPDNPLTLLQQLSAYFAANPTHEKPDLAPGLHATAAACAAAAKAISTSSSASNQSNTDAGTAKKNYEAGIDAGRARVSGLREELSQLLSDTDERWYAFGFDAPSDSAAPEVPDNLVITPGPAGSHTLHADWDDSRRGASYRATLTNAATGAKVAEQLVQDSDASFGDLPAGITVTLTVTARDDQGHESSPSTPASVPVP